jgi:glycolate oxidase iron-sulfur subunit
VSAAGPIIGPAVARLNPAERFLDYEKSLACIHCGLCLASCPTYLETGNENDSPRGRIYLMRAVQDGRLPLADTAVRHIDLCLGCRACEAVCPSGVQYGELLEHTRDHIEKHYRRSPADNFLRRVAIEKIFPFPWRLKLALAPVKWIRALGAAWLLPGLAREALSLIPERTKDVVLPEFSPATPLAPGASEERNGPSARTIDGSPPGRGQGWVPSDGGTPRPRVGFVSGCVMSVLFGETNANSVRLLNHAGCDVVTPRAQSCCGALYAHGGNLERARDCARRNIELFERHELSAIIINAAGCGSTLKEYGHLLRGDAAWAERAARFSARIKDLTEFLVSSFESQANDKTGAQPRAPASGFRVGADSALRIPHSAFKVTYHDACHLAHPQRITKQPRDLVISVAGNNFVELPESDVCCGSAGSYNLTEPEMAGRLQRRKIDNILRTGAQVVVTTNPGCILQIRAGLKKAGANIEVLHIADYLARALDQNTAL